MGVLDLERIEGPLDELDAAVERFLPLRELELASDAAILVGLKYSHHVAVQVELPARFEAGNGQAKPHHLAAVEGAEDLAADLVRYHEHARRKQIDVVEAPDDSLEAHGFEKISRFNQGADGYL